MKFGTDGVRGLANVELTPELALQLGRAAARVLGGGRWAVGRDTRRSGPMLEAAFTAGLAAEGVDVVILGVAPTPEVAWWAANEGAPAAVISASHNEFADNGIKLFAAGGLKVSQEVEAALEAELAGAGHTSSASAPSGVGVGSIRHVDARGGYEASVRASVGTDALHGLRLVIDCAYGAATAVAPDALRDLGADVQVLHCEPDGVNINRACGSTDPTALQAAVRDGGADVGVAFDGDADRVMLVDAHGDVVDGDQIIAVLAHDLAARGMLRHRTVVVTVMTNLGFRLAMAEAGIDVVETPVGDRHVLEALESGGFTLGGEQSGHIIFRELATTGDGLLTAAHVLSVVRRSGRPLHDLVDRAMTRLPQVLRNVRVAERNPAILERLSPEVAAVEAELGEKGRVLVRPSGTEPVIRVMVEAATEATAVAAADRLSAAVATAAA